MIIIIYNQLEIKSSVISHQVLLNHLEITNIHIHILELD
jgi:hypothetical protein